MIGSSIQQNPVHWSGLIFSALQDVQSSIFSEGSKGNDGKTKEVEKERMTDSFLRALVLDE